jgi:hypothetical protein
VQGTSEVTIGVTVDPGGQQGSVRIDPRMTPNVAVDLIEGAIHFKPSAEPFHYM